MRNIISIFSLNMSNTMSHSYSDGLIGRGTVKRLQGEWLYMGITHRTIFSWYNGVYRWNFDVLLRYIIAAPACFQNKLFDPFHLRWHIPIKQPLGTSSNGRALIYHLERNNPKRLMLTSRTKSMNITVGKVSLEDWDLLTWSFGCTDFSPRLWPRISAALFAMTYKNPTTWNRLRRIL